MEPASAGAQLGHRVAGRCPRQAPGSRCPAGGVAHMAHPSLTAGPSPVRATVLLDTAGPLRSRRSSAPLCHCGCLLARFCHQVVPAPQSGRCLRSRPQRVSSSSHGQRGEPCPECPHRRGTPRITIQNGTGRPAGRSSPASPARSPVQGLPRRGLSALDMSQPLALISPVPSSACCHVS